MSSPILSMERLLELRPLGPNEFTAVERPWLPPRVASIYGGTLIAHCILAAEATVPRKDVRLASLHCTFLEGGKSRPPISYIVQREDDLTIRRVRAMQEAKCIFIAALRYSPRSQQSHGPVPTVDFEVMTPTDSTFVKGGGRSVECPFICSDLEPGGTTLKGSTSSPQDTVTSQWIKSRESIATDNLSVHMAAVAYMSDNYFLPTATRVHGIRWGQDPEILPEWLATRRKEPVEVKLMVSLDHSIYFTQTNDAWRADRWLRAEMHSPWAGDGRGLVVQNIYSDDETLVCTAIQEGVVRLKL